MIPASLVSEIETCAPRQQLHAQVGRAAGAVAGVVQRAGPGLGLGHRHPAQDFHSLVVEDAAVRGEKAVMAVVGIGVERHVADQPKLGEFALQQAGRAAHQVIRIERFLAVIAAAFGLSIGEQCEARDAKRHRFAGSLGDPVDRPARDPG